MNMARSKTSARTVLVSFRLPAELLRKLDERADRDRRTRSNLAVLLLERALVHERQAG